MTNGSTSPGQAAATQVAQAPGTTRHSTARRGTPRASTSANHAGILPSRAAEYNNLETPHTHDDAPACTSNTDCCSGYCYPGTMTCAVEVL